MKKAIIASMLAALVSITACTIAAEQKAAPVPPPVKVANFTLAPLPYAQDALAPHYSVETMSYHYGKHHSGYVDNLNKLVVGTKWADEISLENIVKESYGKDDATAIFNNAAQVYNHDMFWKSMKPNGGGEPAGALLEKINASFGSYEKFKTEFTTAAASQFGSGWAWLVQDGDALKIVKTSNADTPIARDLVPLITCDVWEHAYYIDYRNARKSFVETFLDKLVDWDFAASQLK